MLLGRRQSWKLQLLDLSRAADGIIAQEERFGHLELPNGMTLKQALYFYESEPLERVRILRQEERDLNTGRLIDPYEGASREQNNLTCGRGAGITFV